MPQSALTEHPDFQQWLALTPQLYLHCHFPLPFDMLSGEAAEPATETAIQAATHHRQHCQQALKTLYEALRILPANEELVHTAETSFAILARTYAVYGDVTVLLFRCGVPPFDSRR